MFKLNMPNSFLGIKKLKAELQVNTHRWKENVKKYQLLTQMDKFTTLTTFINYCTTAVYNQMFFT